MNPWIQRQGWLYQKITWIKREGREDLQNKSWICYYNKQHCARKSSSHCTVCPLFKFQLSKNIAKKKIIPKNTFSLWIFAFNKFINHVKINWNYILRFMLEWHFYTSFCHDLSKILQIGLVIIFTIPLQFIEIGDLNNLHLWRPSYNFLTLWELNFIH